MNPLSTSRAISDSADPNIASWLERSSPATASIISRSLAAISATNSSPAGVNAAETRRASAGCRCRAMSCFSSARSESVTVGWEMPSSRANSPTTGGGGSPAASVTSRSAWSGVMPFLAVTACLLLRWPRASRSSAATTLPGRSSGRSCAPSTTVQQYTAEPTVRPRA